MNPLASLPSRLKRWQRIVLALTATLIVLILLAWLALPRLIQSQAEQFIAAQTGHRLTMARPEFHPFALRLRLRELALVDPAGQPLLAFDELVVDLAAASLWQRALVFDEIRLSGPVLTLVEQADQQLNWSPLLAALQGPPADPADKPAGLPRFDIRRIELSAGQLDFADRRFTPGFSTRIEPLDLILTDISTLPDDSGKFSLQAKTVFGAQLALDGSIDLNPLALSGRIALQGFALERLAPYLQSHWPAPLAGVAELSAQYRLGNDGEKLDWVVEELNAAVVGLRVPLAAQDAAVSIERVALQGGRFDLANQQLDLATLTVSDTRLDLPHLPQAATLPVLKLETLQVKLAERLATLDRVTLEQGRVQAVRHGDGTIDLVAALQALTPTVSAVPVTPQATPPAEVAAEDAAGVADTAPATAATPWRFRLATLDLAEFAASLRDDSVTPAAAFKLQDVALNVTDISDDLTQALPAKLELTLATGGTLTMAGKLTPATAAADLQLTLKDLALTPAQPYLAERLLIDIVGGTLASQGRLTLNDKGPTYRGDFALRDLLIREAGTTQTLLAWQNLATRELAVTSQRLDIGELRLKGLDSKLIIAKDKSINFQKILKEPATAATAATAVSPVSTFSVNIDRLRFIDGALFFADESLLLPFGTRIHGLRGSVSHLSSQPGGAHGQVELEGEVDEYGMARAVGQLDLFDPTGFMDLRVQFNNVEMTRLTPYVATFAGRRIDSGKLSLDLQYKLQQRQLSGDNQIIVDRLKLGERVDSPNAKDLPLDLAIALLEDSDGRIDLGLPVSGSLDDPQFSIGGIVWKAISNVLTKIVTAPFRALGALFGGGEKLDSIAFEAGARQLAPPEREKLVKLASALGKRPNLRLGISGTWTEEDRLALQDAQLRRSLLKANGEKVNEERDPGPLSTAQPKVRAALEALYQSRLGAADLAALKEGFRQANPGQLEEGLTGKMMSRFSGLLREKKTLSAEEVGSLKGGDFYAILYQRLRASESVPDVRLITLAEARAAQALRVLTEAGLATTRLQQRPAEAAQPQPDMQAQAEQAAQATGAPLKLALEPMAKN